MQILESIKDIIRQNYVTEEKVDTVIAALDYHAEEFAQIDDNQYLAQRLTEVLLAASNDKHFNVQYADAGENRQAPQRINFRPERNNNFFYEVKRLTGNIGYIDFRLFAYPTPEVAQTAIAAMAFLANTDAVIFDIRRNRGGTPEMIRLILSYFYEGATHINTFYERPSNRYSQSWTTPHVQGKKMSDMPVYVLTSNMTGSAAEEFAYDIQQSKRGVVIGQTTAGAGHIAAMMPLVDGFSMIVPIGKPINPHSNTGWEGIGVQPDIATDYDDALMTAHIQALDTLLEKTEDDDLRAFRQWELELVKACANPYQVDNPQQYTGQFGNIQISYQDGALIYQSPRLSTTLLPLSHHTFSVLDEIRVTFEGDTLHINRRDTPSRESHRRTG